MQHICATCYKETKAKEFHPETSNTCPYFKRQWLRRRYNSEVEATTRESPANKLEGRKISEISQRYATPNDYANIRDLDRTDRGVGSKQTGIPERQTDKIDKGIKPEDSRESENTQIDERDIEIKDSSKQTDIPIEQTEEIDMGIHTESKGGKQTENRGVPTGNKMVDLVSYMAKANRAIRQSGMPNVKHCRIPEPSKLNLEVWEQELADYQDKGIVEFLRYGWPISYNGSELKNS